MSVKNQKLHEQFDAEVSTSSNNGSSSGKPIFQGISIFVDGFTIPSSQVWPNTSPLYFYSYRLDKDEAILLSGMDRLDSRSASGSPSGTDEESSNHFRVPYQLDQLASEAQNQPKLSAFFSLRSSPVSNGSMTYASGEDPSLEGGTNNEADTSGHSGSMEHSRPCTRESDDNKSSVGILDQASPSRHSASVSSYNAKSSTSSAIAGPSNQHHSTLVDPNFVENYFKVLGEVDTVSVFPSFKDSSSIVNASAQGTFVMHVDMLVFSQEYGPEYLLRDAKALCPHLVIFPYDFDAYEEVADQFYNILHKHCKKVQAVSCDEAFLEVTQSKEEDPQFLASVIRKEIFETTKCTASAGISGNLLMARLATRGAKPDGQCYIPPEKVDDYLHELSIKALPGIGHVLEEKLRKETNFDMWAVAHDFPVELSNFLLMDNRGPIFFSPPPLPPPILSNNHIHSLMKIDVIQADEPEGKCRLPLLPRNAIPRFSLGNAIPKRKNRAPKEDGSLPEQIGYKSNTPKPNRTKSSLVSVKSRQIENQSELWRAFEVDR
ncbi:DNA-directed DNA polymerase [Actinidia rufa]|uniref:DNA-directed DNA polymerase n=1 Tax=Actinidia rufa TaxID=165716 RepID=A0A7J0FAU0_9ERIC|nr:DNA-directed DNA polymerase [Actinidia rufa]